MAIYGKGFRGGKSQEIQIKVDEENTQFEELFLQYRDELSELSNKNVKLKEKMVNLKESVLLNNSLQKEMEKFLYNSVIEDLYEVFKERKAFDSMLSAKIATLQEQQKKNIEIKGSITKLLNEIHSIVND